MQLLSPVGYCCIFFVMLYKYIVYWSQNSKRLCTLNQNRSMQPEAMKMLTPHSQWYKKNTGATEKHNRHSLRNTRVKCWRGWMVIDRGNNNFIVLSPIVGITLWSDIRKCLVLVSTTVCVRCDGGNDWSNCIKSKFLAKVTTGLEHCTCLLNDVNVCCLVLR